MSIDRNKNGCFIIDCSGSPFGGLSAGGVVALTVPLAFGVPGSSGVVSMAVPLAAFVLLLALPWCCAFGGLPADVSVLIKLVRVLVGDCLALCE